MNNRTMLIFTLLLIPFFLFGRKTSQKIKLQENGFFKIEMYRDEIDTLYKKETYRNRKAKNILKVVYYYTKHPGKIERKTLYFDKYNYRTILFLEYVQKNSHHFLNLTMHFDRKTGNFKEIINYADEEPELIRQTEKFYNQEGKRTKTIIYYHIGKENYLEKVVNYYDENQMVIQKDSYFYKSGNPDNITLIKIFYSANNGILMKVKTETYYFEKDGHGKHIKEVKLY